MMFVLMQILAAGFAVGIVFADPNPISGGVATVCVLLTIGSMVRRVNDG